MPDERRVVIVEFFGLPGVGKSTLAAVLVKALRSEGDPASCPTSMIGPNVSPALRYLRKSTRIGSTTLRVPGASLRLLRGIADSEQETVTQVGKRWADFMLAQALLSQASSTGSVVLDQGIMQAIWSIGLRGHLAKPLEALRSTVGVWSLPDRVIVVEAPLDHIVERLRSRTSRHSRVQGSGMSLASELERARGLMSRVLAEASSVGLASDSMITIENPDHSSPEDLVSRILPLLTYGRR